MSLVLVVDDEPDLIDVLDEFLTSAGHSVTKCSCGAEALQLLKQKTFDLILSDVKMKDVNGLELYHQFKDIQDSETRFILMTGDLDLMSSESAYAMGIDELIHKPFDLETLKLVINYLVDAKENPSHEVFFPIPADEFTISTSNHYDIYIKINTKYVCLIPSGQEFTHAKLEHFIKRGVKQIFLTAADYAKYTDLHLTIATNTETNPLSYAKKAKIFNQMKSAIFKSSLIKMLDKNISTKALNNFENFSQIAFKNQQLERLLTSFINENSDLAYKSCLLATISSCIADLWRWNSPKIQGRIILAALLCDIGLQKDLADYEGHPHQSFKILSDIEGLPEEVLHVALQHHENASGQGFPQKIHRSQVHPYSKIIHTVNEFLEVLAQEENKSQAKPALDKLLQFQRKIVSEQVLKSLYLVFNLNVPKELDGLLLPSQISRVI